jgi:hypothetical protein
VLILGFAPKMYKKEHKIHFRSVHVDDAEAMATAKAAVREKHPDVIHSNTWKSIYGLFEGDSWVVNKFD